MRADSRGRGPTPAGRPRFLTTRWSLLAAAGSADPARSRGALESLCRSYWYPLYAYVRRRGFPAQDAADLTQGFFASFLEHADLAALAPGRGRFRAFLLASIRNFIGNERERAAAQKRGGGATPIPLDSEAADERYRVDPASHLDPERLFERQWALELLARALATLREEYDAAGKRELFEALAPELQGRERDAPLAEIAARLSSTEGAVKVAVHRLRKRFRERLREEIADTVGREEDVEVEIRDLFRALSS